MAEWKIVAGLVVVFILECLTRRLDLSEAQKSRIAALIDRAPVGSLTKT